MRVLCPSVLLNAWEEAASQPVLKRAATLLAAYWPERSVTDWETVEMGERDRALLHMRGEIFGSRLEAAVSCPECGERLELSFTVAEITTPALPGAFEPLHLTMDGYDVTYRLPATADVLALKQGEGEVELLDRCVEARLGGEMIPAHCLPARVVDAVTDAMALADPQADVRLAMECPACAHCWSAIFDIFSFLWSEMEDWAVNTLREVHALSSAYGWTEGEVLSLSARRRRMYLDMVTG